MKGAGKYYEENMNMFGEFRLVKALTDAQIAAMRDPKLAVNTKLPRITKSWMPSRASLPTHGP